VEAGIAAYWSPAVLIKVVSTCPAFPIALSVSTIAKRPGSSCGCATGKSQKQTNASPVVTASAVRAQPYRPG
jgi:hypothetical protein